MPTDIECYPFKIKIEVNQGDPISPLRSDCAIEEIFKNFNWNNYGIKIDDDFFKNFRFANNIVPVAGSSDELQK